ncbi:hypothetical protein GH714_014151 [Hevea brasiliensis]|uniref:Cytochrome P450 n=1 Tax=Hevea brasiliensis TaxID=3981 RepID=A0A6A6NH16_HEVBR|nr:hypothetical protein GH714_014151 [Hevea brasiliensis]
MSELLSNRRLEMVKNVQSSEVDVGIRKLYDLWVKNSCHPVLVELNHWFEDLTLNVLVKIVAGKCFAGGSDDVEARRSLDGRASPKESFRRAQDEGEQDFFDLMLSLEEEGRLSGFPYDEKLVSRLPVCDTTSTMLTWAISLLLNNRFALKKAQEELDLHVGVERQVDESDLKNLVYLQAVIKETLRLYPVAPLSGPRQALEDCTIGGYHVPAGTRLMVNVWKIHRDPRLWTDPSAFQPQRFLTSHVGVDVRGQHFVLIPFGSGRRSCPGTSFALHALHLTIARLLHAFDLSTPMDQPVDMTEGPGVILPKATPLEVLLSPRLPAKLYSF